MPEAMKLIRKELGNDAIILNSRVVQSDGFLGFFKKRSIEVVAALDTKSIESVNPILKEKQNKIDTSVSKLDFNTQKAIDKVEVGETEVLRLELLELKSLLKQVKTDTENSGIPLPK